MIDKDGYRSNVGIILSNKHGSLLWARRVGQDAWQFPQGGIEDRESLEEALYRELVEEIGLQKHHVEILAQTRNWLRYQLPKNLQRLDQKPVCIGQKQIWFLLLLKAPEEKVNLRLSEFPEFDQWRWVDYWHPLSEVVSFKQDVYRSALNEFAPLMTRFNSGSLSNM